MLGPIGPWHYQALALVLFAMGVIGFLVRRNVIVMALCIELMLNAANLSLVAFGRQHADHAGQIFAFVVMTVAAVEVALGLAIIIALVRHRDTVNVQDARLMKG
jgi:NADH-quinone oxidoreductase subunit K